MTNCKNCNQPLNGTFCSSCGLPATLKRIDRHYISHELLHLLHFEKGFLFTAKDLMLRPGQSIREFIFDNRNKHVKPIAYLILTSLLFTLVAHLFHVDELYNSKEKINTGSVSVDNIMLWVQANYGYSNLIYGLFYTLMVKLFFKKYQFNFFEIMVLMCFIMGQSMLLLTIETFFIDLLGIKMFGIILLLISIIYPTWAIGQFFDGSKISSYVKAFLAYLLGYILFQIAIVIVGMSYDAIIKSI